MNMSGLTRIPGFPPLPRRKKQKKKKGKITAGPGGGAVFPDYSRATIGMGDLTSPFGGHIGATAGPGDTGGGDAGGAMGGEGGGMAGESLEVPTEDNEEVKELNPLLDSDEKDEREDEHEFGYTMLVLTDSIANIIFHWINNSIPKDILSEKGIPDLLHTTVKYGLHDGEPDKVEDLIQDFGTVPITMKSIGLFTDHPDFDVLHIKVESEKLKNLNTLISDNIECTDTYDTYIPHITLAYVKKGSCDDLDGNKFFNDLSDHMDEVCFIGKDGSEHFLSLV